MIGEHFYNRTVKRAVIAFGTLFNNIHIKRTYKSGKDKIVPVQVSYGPREKWVELSKKKSQQFLQTLPKITFEAVTLNYDVNRKLVSNNRIMKARTTSAGTAIDTNLVPTPYNLNFTMFIQAKTLDDGWQIIEQIIPFFTPAYTLKIKDSSSIENQINMPITLTSVTWTDDYQGAPNDPRLLEFSLEFDVKVNFYGPSTKGSTGIILKTDTTVNAVSDSDNNIIDLSTIDRVISADGTFKNSFTFDKGISNRYEPNNDLHASGYNPITNFKQIGYSTIETYTKDTIVFWEGYFYKALKFAAIGVVPGTDTQTWGRFSNPNITSSRTLISGAEGQSENPTAPTITTLDGFGSSTPSLIPISILPSDLQPPRLITWSLDTENGVLTLVFDEEIFASRTIPTSISIHGINGAHTLTSNTSIILPQNNTDTLTLSLGNDIEDIRRISLNSDNASQYAISALAGWAQDLVGNLTAAIPVPVFNTSTGLFVPPASTPIAITRAGSDIIAPVVLSFLLNLEAKTLELTFDDNLIVSTFSYKPITIGGVYTLNTVESTTFSDVGNKRLTIVFNDVIRNEIDDALNNPPLAQPVSYSIPADFVIDDSGNPNTLITASNGTLVPFDRLAPAITSWYINLNNAEQTDSSLGVTVPANTIQFDFKNEPLGVQLSTLDLTKLSLTGVGTFFTNGTITLENGIATTPDGSAISKIINIELTGTLLDDIEKRTHNGLQPISLSGELDFVRDHNNNQGEAFGTGLNKLFTSLAFRDNDVIPPLLSEWNLDLSPSGSSLQLVFSGTPDMSTFNPDTFTISGYQPISSLFSINTTNNTIDYILSTEDRNNLRYATGNIKSDTLLNVTSGMILDNVGNPLTPLTGVLSNVFVQGNDITRPVPLTFALDLNEAEAIITFNSAINTSVFTYSSLRISASTADQGVLLNAARVTAAFNTAGTILTLTLDSTLVTEIDTETSGLTSAVFLMPEAFVTDLNENNNNLTTGVVTILGLDILPPVITSWKINLDDAIRNGYPGNSIILNFDNEQTGVDSSTIDLSKLFIQGVGSFNNGVIDLTSGVVQETGITKTITITYTGSKLDDIEKVTHNATQLVRLFGENTYILDRSGNQGLAFGALNSNENIVAVVAIRDPFGVAPILVEYVENTSTPWSLNLTTGVLIINLFNNPSSTPTVDHDPDLSTFTDISNITLGVFPNAHTLSSSTFTTNNNTITISLSQTDLDSLLLATRNNVTDSILTIAPGTILDEEGEPNVGSSFTLTTEHFVPGIITGAPQINNIELNLNNDTITVSFSGRVTPNSLISNLNRITFTSDNTRVNSGSFTLTGGNVITTVDNDFIEVKLEENDAYILGLLTYNSERDIDANTKVDISAGLAVDNLNRATPGASLIDSDVILRNDLTDITRPELITPPNLIIDLPTSRLTMSFQEFMAHSYTINNVTRSLIDPSDFNVFPNNTATGSESYQLSTTPGFDRSSLITVDDSSTISFALGIGPNPFLGTLVSDPNVPDTFDPDGSALDFIVSANLPLFSVVDHFHNNEHATGSVFLNQLDISGNFIDGDPSDATSDDKETVRTNLIQFLTDNNIKTGEDIYNDETSNGTDTSAIDSLYTERRLYGVDSNNNLSWKHNRAFEAADWIFSSTGVGFKIGIVGIATSAGVSVSIYLNGPLNGIREDGIPTYTFGSSNVVGGDGSNSGNLTSITQRGFFGGSPPGLRFDGAGSVVVDDILQIDDKVTKLPRGGIPNTSYDIVNLIIKFDVNDGLGEDYYVIFKPVALPTPGNTGTPADYSNYAQGNDVYVQKVNPPNVDANGNPLGDTLQVTNLFAQGTTPETYLAPNGASVVIPEIVLQDKAGNPIEPSTSTASTVSFITPTP